MLRRRSSSIILLYSLFSAAISSHLSRTSSDVLDAEIGPAMLPRLPAEGQAFLHGQELFPEISGEVNLESTKKKSEHAPHRYSHSHFWRRLSLSVPMMTR